MSAHRRKLFLLVLCIFFVPSQPGEAASVPVGFNDAQVASGLTSPSAMTVMPDGRVLVTQQDGQIKIIKADRMLSTNFYTVQSVDTFFERGCLGITTDPNFTSNHFVYIYFTRKNGTTSHNRILRVTEANDVAVPGSERVVFDLPNVPDSTKWHMGGALHFGTDGKLYVAVGNHEDNPQPPSTSNSQNLSNPFGKILRINADGTIPSDNPFFNTAGAFKAIYCLGFRNPFTFAIQPGTGLMFINDVGQSSFEEINRGQRAGNYGWPSVEGNGSDSRFINPAFAYSHSAGCAITGGVFYNSPAAQFPASFVGKYLFADFCAGTIRVLDPANNSANSFVTGISFPVNIDIAPDGSLYYLARNQQTGTPNPGGGTVGKITFTGSQAPRITRHPMSQTIFLGEPVTFTVAADGATGFQWQRNGSNISGATSSSFTIASTALSDNGARFRAIAGNAFGNTTSNEAILTITTNRFPAARINTPAAGDTFATGDVINFSGTGTDPEDGTLPGSAFTWQVDYQHDSHVHPFIPPTSGSTSGSFTVADFESSQANTWLRIFLTVRDSGGQTNTAFRDIRPRTSISNMTPVGTPVNGWGPIERDMSNGETAAGDGRTITLDGIAYGKGLGVHAPSDVRFNLNGMCSGNFIADVGLDDEVGNNGSVVFQVFLDGIQVFNSGTVRGSDLRKSINVSVAGRNELRLIVTDAGDGKGFDHADWAGARVTGCGTSSALVTNLSVRDTANAANWSIQSNLQAGNTAFGDRTHTFETIPSSLAGSTWIRTANSSKLFAGNPVATFSLTAAADVFISLDNRAPVPSWVDETWTDTGMDLVIRENATTTRSFSIFRKGFAAGQVALGPWNSNAISMYSAVIK